ncbi:hypothetical protein [Polycladomyces subterraneus]|uniref:Uncharacterized protein n=1 Tax=Polycladomyces subterraneus TaxID=1016997 RepID=A0ABT8IP64_9BACL|nr:hypothetical protein [Polycladomyces subterraneus]MDN4594579.1 hypothetical protein [Polycladomyces subterraneus]
MARRRNMIHVLAQNSLNVKQKRKRSNIYYQTALKELRKRCNDWRPGDITIADIENCILAKKESGLKVSGINMYIRRGGCFSAFYMKRVFASVERLIPVS